ncbi:Hypothetical protein PHPALM_3194 [Phytophthora palmivora]|uniref:Uncharacterized protein n=1 Tax=Phytophthora palmivora TaxID=4796 RepID=A0A2P4YN35_9STRA|nr:Hypothetical protein PHPALM_3194 [Phytophthora palmivora]
MQTKFSSTPIVSERLKPLYYSAVRRRELRATPIEGTTDMPVQFLAILYHHEIILEIEKVNLLTTFYANNPKKMSKPYKSIHVLRMQWQNMPEEGWKIRDMYTRDSRHTRAGTPLSRNARSYLNICKQSESTHHHRSTELPPRSIIRPASECVPAYERTH